MKEDNINILLFRGLKDDFSDSERRRIEEIVKSAATDAYDILDVKGVVNILVRPRGSTSIAVLENHKNRKAYVWGRAYFDSIEIHVAPHKWKEKNLRGVVYHEICHIPRLRARKEKETVLEIIFREGLAATFHYLHIPDLEPHYFGYRAETVKTWLPRLKKEMNKPGYDGLFWHHKSRNYMIGIYLMREIYKHHPTLDHTKLVRKSPKELLRLSKVVL